MMRLMFVLLAALGVFASTAGAEPYWIAYEGNDFPENEGWTREYGDEHGPDHGGAVRRIEDGTLVTESLHNPLVYDYQAMYRFIGLGADELFVMRWRLKVDEVSAFYDESVTVFSDDARGVSLQFWPTHVVSSYEDAVAFPFTLGEYHTFEFSSSDMRSYVLSMDDEFTWSGEFRNVFTSSMVAWGDTLQGAGSVVAWDYFEFGVVPEPGGALMLSCVGLAAFRRCCRTK